MKTTSKKLLSILLAILMVATTIPTFAITALAEANPTVLNITLDLDTSVQLGTKPADYKISGAYLSDYSDNCEDFGYEGLPYFYLANNQCYGTTGEGAPTGLAIYPDEKGNQWCWMNGPYTEGNRYGNMIFISDSDLETKPDKFNVNGVLYNVLDFNNWYYCLLDLGVADSTGKLSGGDFACKHTYGTKGDSRYTCQTCGEIDKEKQTEALLADAKVDALDAIKEAVGECEEKAVLDVADKYASAINEAESIEDVEAITEEAIKAIQDAMHKHSHTSKVTTPATCTKDGVRTYTCSCGDTYTEPVAMIGHTYTSKVTKLATYVKAGVETHTCSNCGDSYTVVIPRLEITSDVKYNNSTALNAGFKVASSNKDVKATWGKVADADGYIVYAAYCGKSYKAIKTIKGNKTKSYSFTKLNGKKLNLDKNIKVYVVAYKVIDGKKVEFGKTIDAHIVGGWNRVYTNPTKVAVKDNKVTLAKGKTSKINATVTYKYEGKKAISNKHAAEKRYRSSNKAVATVDANGKITAVGKGICTVYVFAKNGTSAKITVTVK